MRAPAVAALAAAAAAAACLAWERRRQRRESGEDGSEEAGTVGPSAADGKSEEELLQEVGLRSKALVYVVSDKSNRHFSAPNLSKYLRQRGVDVHEGATPEETIQVNARRLLELLDRERAGSGANRGLLRHALLDGPVPREELEALLPAVKDAYVQQPLDYGRNSRYGDRWRISCYLVVMENWKPRIQPHEPMVRCLSSVMHRCTEAYAAWYCKARSLASVDVHVMNAFVTRYRPVHEEDQLKKHIDGANVDGSVILALPTDDPFEGGALHVWDGKPQQEFVYRMQPGQVVFLDNAVWHQAKPITSGTRWALVLFLRLTSPSAR